MAGNATTQQLVGEFIEKADCVLLCYTLTSDLSFKNLDDWIEEIQKTDKGNNIPIAIAATKSDRAINERAVSTSRMETLKRNTKNCFYAAEVTAWTDNVSYVNDLFEKLARQVVSKRP